MIDDPPPEHPQANIHELFQTALSMVNDRCTRVGQGRCGELRDDRHRGTHARTCGRPDAAMLGEVRAGHRKGPGPEDKIN
jgi:hypothetical protein